MNKQSLVNKQPTFSAVINSEGYKKLINNTLRDPKRANRFVASVISAVSANPELQECAPETIMSAAFLGEALELSPSPQLGQYWLVPFKDKKRGAKVAQFQLGVNGYKQLAIRSGQYKDIEVIEVRQGEYVGRNTENGKPIFKFIEDDETRENLPVIGYMAYFELLNGFRKTIYWPKEKMIKHADKYSKAFNYQKYQELLAGKIPESDMWQFSSPWYSQFDMMSLKTMIRQLISKWGIMSIDMASAIEKDGALIKENGDAEYIEADYNEITGEVSEPLPIESNPTEEPSTPESDDPFADK